LRSEHGFAIGHREAADALRALDVIGISDRDRARSALRLVCCGTHAQTLAFDRAFDAFFAEASAGLPQNAYAPRHTRPGPKPPEAPDDKREPAPPKERADDPDDGGSANAVTRRTVDDDGTDANAWHHLRARYSPAAARGEALRIDPRRVAKLQTVAQRLIRSVRLGRTRRWKPRDRGGRLDMRRTLRASLETGGDPVALRFLGHPLRNPRFVVLIDGSRSMAEHGDVMVAFTAALCACSTRTRAFFFSTALRDVTRELRAAVRAGGTFADLGEAWGGGTKIGANLAAFVRDWGARLLTPQTVILVFSDGLDVGAVPQLTRAMSELRRRSAGIIWLNPHAATPGYTPAARGMRAALPFIALLSAANDEHGFEMLAKRVAQTDPLRR
jgi:uncharacterized protein with von Willebrand factor type A (vWA) domain